MKICKHHIALFLFLLFCFGQLSSVLLLHELQAHRQITRKEIFSSKKNQSFVFTLKDWSNAKWHHDHELEINGNMFDLKSFQKTDENVVAIGHFDTTENDLNAQTEKQNNDNQKTKKSTVQSSPFIQNEISNFVFFQEKEIRNLQSIYRTTLLSEFLQLDSPPPKV